jgi:hypothetical protein
LAASLESLVQRLPDRFEAARHEDRWRLSSESYGVEIQFIEFGAERTFDFHAQRPFALTAVGSYQGLHDYLYDRFYAAGNALKPTGFRIEREEQGGRLLLKLSGLEYRYIPEEGE